MSNFYCEHCGAACYESDGVYISGCHHYPPDDIAGADIMCGCYDIYPLKSAGGQAITKTGHCPNCLVARGLDETD